MLDRQIKIIATMNIIKRQASLRRLFLSLIEITNIKGMKKPKAHSAVSILASSSYMINSI